MYLVQFSPNPESGSVTLEQTCPLSAPNALRYYKSLWRQCLLIPSVKGSRG